MKTDFKFSNLLGTVYCKGDLLFTPDGQTLLSPVGNRVTVFDLVNNKSYTLPYSHRRNISRIALNPQGNLLLSIGEDGHAILANFPRRIALHHFTFKGAVSALSFSPTGRHFAIGLGRFLEIWKTPSVAGSQGKDGIEFAPFVRHHRHAGHHDTIKSLQWSSDSRFILSASKDLTARIWSLNPEEGFVPTTLGGHRKAVLGAWFSKDQETIYTVSLDGAFFGWQYTASEDDDPGDPETPLRWRIMERHYFLQNNADVRCAAFHAFSNLLVVGFSNGRFGLYEVPGFTTIHTLSISQNGIDTVTLNSTGEWLAFGASKLGQLLVWEWQSESYILKQQSHSDSLNAVSYSPDGQRVITAADDGKVKVWDTQSGFCIVTFTEHSSGVTACEYARRGNVLFTSSLDGSIRAWDLIRYRNFRTFTAPTRLSFSCLAIDPSGEVVCAGSLDSFDIHIWSVQTGQFLDQLSGHEGPISSMAFASSGGVIVTGSWDRTVRIWNIFGRTQTSEPLQLSSDILSVAIRPDAKQIAVSTLDGQLTFWSVSEAIQEAGVDGRRDISGGRKVTDRRTAANVTGTQSFGTLCYSSDGTCIIAGGSSKYICLYDVQSGVLLKKFTVSVNLSLDGTQEFLNNRNLTDAGPAGLIDTQGEASDLEDRIDRGMPGATRGDLASRRTSPTVRVPAISFSPTGRAFCAATTEGLLIYGLDAAIQFDPFDLDLDINPANTLSTLARRDFTRSLIMAFRLNEAWLVRRVYENIPVDQMALIVQDLPSVYVARLLRFVAQATDDTPHLEFNLRWIEELVTVHGGFLMDRRNDLEAEMRLVQKAVAKIQGELMKISDENTYTLDYLLSQPAQVEIS